MALIHASEIERSGPGPLTARFTVPIAAEVVPEAAVPAAGVVVPLGDAALPVADVALLLEPRNDSTLAWAGVIEINSFSASGQSTAELSTDDRRDKPEVY